MNRENLQIEVLKHLNDKLAKLQKDTSVYIPWGYNILIQDNIILCNIALAVAHPSSSTRNYSLVLLGPSNVKEIAQFIFEQIWNVQILTLINDFLRSYFIDANVGD